MNYVSKTNTELTQIINWK